MNYLKNNNMNSKIFNLNKDIQNVLSYGISLEERKDKRDKLKKLCKKNGIPLHLFIAQRHPEGGKRGCLDSHLRIIKEAYANKENTKAKNLLIFEDDIEFVDSLQLNKGLQPSNQVVNSLSLSSAFKNGVPKDYDMLYFGGTVHRVIDRESYAGWVQMSCWTTHAYLINLEKDEMVQKIIRDLENYKEEIDRYYLNEIHTQYKAYMCNPMVIIQQAGFSDIENCEVNYDFMQKTLDGLRTPEHTVGPNKEYILKLPNLSDEQLPKVSIITPTRNRVHLFSIPLRNYALFNYPAEKMEWIIVEDGKDDVSSMIPSIYVKSGLVKHIHMGKDAELTIAEKRNIGVQNSSGKYILHMDDDDYYIPESILARVKILMKYEKEGIECVGCSLIGTYNLISNTSSMASDGMISLSEASMGYTKRFWEQKPFDGNCVRGEHKSFMEGRLDKILDIPYVFIIIAFNHKNNFSEVYRGDNGKKDDKGLIKVEGKVANFYDMWDIDTQLFIEELRGTLL
jgi:GR25 family glycosyltransferase involved in LPS biosynthesis